MLSPRRGAASSKEDLGQDRSYLKVRVHVEHGPMLDLHIPSPLPEFVGQLFEFVWNAFCKREKEYIEELELLGIKQGGFIDKDDFVLRVGGSQVYLKNEYPMARLMRAWRLFGRKGETLLDLVRKIEIGNNTSLQVFISF